jgi:hypothetical protein
MGAHRIPARHHSKPKPSDFSDQAPIQMQETESSFQVDAWFDENFHRQMHWICIPVVFCNATDSGLVGLSHPDYRHPIQDANDLLVAVIMCFPYDRSIITQEVKS